MSTHSELVSVESVAGFNRFTCNGSLRHSRSADNTRLIGLPRGSFTQECDPPENPAFTALIETRDLGPFRATGLKVALDSLSAIMADVKREHPDLAGRLGSAGMLCCRLVRGSTSVISSHAWGLAIDLTIDGKLDARGDGRIQRGLFDLWPIFNRHRFWWGAAFPTEDAMHFEASAQLVEDWAASGAFGTPPAGAGVPRALTVGDRGSEVLRLQQALNRALAPVRIDEDGLFGPQTRHAVLTFQSRSGLRPDGMAGRATLKLLGLA